MKSHEKRNTKTAIMFAISLSFLIFAGSTFALLGSLVLSQIETTIGADIYAIASDNSLKSLIDDGKISNFL